MQDMLARVRCLGTVESSYELYDERLRNQGSIVLGFKCSHVLLAFA